MKFCWFMILLLAAAALDLRSAGGVTGETRIPEHTCHKIIGANACNLQTCVEECSKEAAGIGGCNGDTCFCTYFCKDPPL